MKKQISIGKVLFLFLLFAGNIAKAQSLEFAPIGAEWHYEYRNFYINGYLHVEVVSDTVIQDMFCKKLHKHYYLFNSWAGEEYDFSCGTAYISQLDDSLMIYRNGLFYKLVDFGAEVGDSWVVPATYEDCSCFDSIGRVFVVGKGVDNISGRELRYVELRTSEDSFWGFEDSYHPIKYYERIGPVAAYMFPEQYCSADCFEGGPLRCYFDSEFGEINVSYPYHECGYVSVPEIEQQVAVFPNPTTDELSLFLPDNVTYTLEMYNSLGVCIKHVTFKGSESKVDLSEYPSGLYHFLIRDESKKYSITIVKQ